MPLMIDQHDNAQRIHEKGFGIKLDPYKCTKDDLAQAIQKLLNDVELREKIKIISEKIQNEVKSDKLVKLIEGLIKEK